MSNKITKSHEITDARIQFVSLVDKAANKRTFLITKAAKGKGTFESSGRILKAADHYVTGVVYEPMAADTDDEYMTAEEITKAAHWFMKNSGKVDLQHNFEALDGADVVESWIAKEDTTINGEAVTAGTWLMTVEVTDPAVWDAIEKGEITGFSMGGQGKVAVEDTDLDEKKGLLKRVAEAMGLRKSEMSDIYDESRMRGNFWDALTALEDSLYKYNPTTETWEYETDEKEIRDNLADFNAIITDILTSGNSVLKAIGQPVAKSGRKISSKNRETLGGIYESLGKFLDSLDGEDTAEEGETVDEEKLEKMVEEAVAKAMAPAEEPPAEGTEPTIEQAAQEAVAKAMENVPDMITKAVEAAMAKASGNPTNLGDEGNIEKAEEEPFFLAGLL